MFDEDGLDGCISLFCDEGEAFLERIDRLRASAGALRKNQEILACFEFSHTSADERGALVVRDESREPRRAAEKRALNQIRSHDADRAGNDGKQDDSVDQAWMIGSEDRSREALEPFRLGKARCRLRRFCRRNATIL